MSGVRAHKLVKKATDEKRRKSFRYNYDNYLKGSREEFCLFCNGHPAPEGIFEVANLNYPISCIERTAKGSMKFTLNIKIKYWRSYDK